MIAPDPRPGPIISWPGRGFGDNAFLETFVGALEAAGHSVISDNGAAPGRADQAVALVVHWPERAVWGVPPGPRRAWRLTRLAMALVMRPRGQALIWIVHNLAPHDASPLLRTLWRLGFRLLSRKVDAAATLSPSTTAIVTAALPALRTKPLIGLRHPAYTVAPLTAAARAAARAGFGLTPDDRVIGYCGLLRPYKGLETLIRAFQDMEAPNARLLLAGTPKDADYVEKLQTAARGDARVILHAAALDAAGFDAALQSCDVIGAPFSSYLHSGSLVHALSAARPVVTPRTPFAEDLAAAVGPRWMRLYDGALTAAALESALDDTPAPQEAPDMTPFAPERFSQELAQLVREAGVR